MALGTLIAIPIAVTANQQYEITIEGTSTPTTQKVKKGTLIGALTEPQLDGYTFKCWTDENGTEISASTIISGDMTIYAKFVFSPTYYINGTQGMTTITLNKGATIEDFASALVAESVSTDKTGYEFVGWSTGEDGDVLGSGIQVTPDMTLYAVYSQILTISYSVDLLDGDTISGDIEIAENIATYDNVVAMINQKEDIKDTDSHSFWWYDEDGDIVDANTNMTTVSSLVGMYDEQVFTFTLSDDETYYSVSANDKTLAEYVIPENYKSAVVTAVVGFGFSSCKNMTSIFLPDTLTSIGEFVFKGCTNLTSITIPKNVSSIYMGEYGIIECDIIESIVVDSENTTYHSDGNCLIETATKTLITGCKNSVIPTDGSVTIIHWCAFESCGLTSITIPKNVVSVGDGGIAFLGCSLLATVTIDSSTIASGIIGGTWTTGGLMNACTTLYINKDALSTVPTAFTLRGEYVKTDTDKDGYVKYILQEKITYTIGDATGSVYIDAGQTLQDALDKITASGVTIEKDGYSVSWYTNSTYTTSIATTTKIWSNTSIYAKYTEDSTDDTTE